MVYQLRLFPLYQMAQIASSLTVIPLNFSLFKTVIIICVRWSGLFIFLWANFNVAELKVKGTVV